jgi:hypothetical protein
MMITQKKKATACWIIATLIVMLLAGCLSLPAKNSTTSLADKQSTNDSELTDNGVSANSSSSNGNMNSTESSSASSEISYPVIDQSTLASSSKLILNQTVTTNLYTISVPESWDVKNLGNTENSPLVPMLYFNMKSDTVYGGGIYLQESDAVAGQTIPNMDDLLQGMLPNHTVITDKERLTGLFTDAYLLKVDQSLPAASGDTTVTHWTYIILVDKNQTTTTKLVGYELFFSSDLASEADAVKVADSFRLL